MSSHSEIVLSSVGTEHGPYRVALVNAPNQTASLVIACLHSTDIQVEVVPNAAATAFLNAANRFSVVLVDATSDPAAGLSCCVRLRAVKRRPLKILLMIGRGDLETAQLGLAAGATDLLTEPPDGELFALCVRAVCQSLVTPSSEPEPRRSAREAWLRNSLVAAHEHGELELHYQPRIDIEGKRITSMEALARWYPADRPPIPPSEFIPIAEQTGAINVIGSDFLRRACVEAKRWDDEGIVDVSVSINASVRQFETGQIFESVTNALIESGLNPQSLEVEVTESLMIEGVSFVDEALHELRSIGVKISLDDFGTGYSSLRCLTTVPLDILKLDRSIILGVGEDVQVSRVVRTICSLARDLGFRTVAEGVDHESMLPALEEAGCDEIQGFLFASAMPPDVALDFLKSAKRLRKPETEPTS